MLLRALEKVSSPFLLLLLSCSRRLASNRRPNHKLTFLPLPLLLLSRSLTLSLSFSSGGAGNIHSPGGASNHTLVEPRVSFDHKVSGRGGAGNFHPSAHGNGNGTPASPSPEDRGRAGGENRPHASGGGGVVEGLKNLVRDFSRSKSRERK